MMVRPPLKGKGTAASVRRGATGGTAARRADGRRAGTAARSRGRASLIVGAALVGAAILMCLVSLVWTPYDPTAMDLPMRFAAPHPAHPLGCDQFGRDILSRLMCAAQPALLVGLGAVGLASLVGFVVGAAAALAPAAIRNAIMRVVDALAAFPGILLALLLVCALGRGLASAIIAVAFFTMPVFARLTAQMTLEMLDDAYVTAARSFGAGRAYVLIAHVLPLLGPRLLVQFSASVGTAMLLEAALSFLGLGVQPPLASWGYMLSESMSYVLGHPGLALAPGIALMLVVLGFNLLGDALSDRLAAGALLGFGVPKVDDVTHTAGTACPAGSGEPADGDACVSRAPRRPVEPWAPGRARPVLEARGLTITSADGRVLVDGVDLVVGHGECVAVVGESGSGKTMTARAAIGLAPKGVAIDARVLQLAGRDVLADDVDEARELLGRHVGVVFQNSGTHLHPLMRVGTQMVDGFLTWNPGVRRTEATVMARDLLARVGIDDPDRVLASRPWQLSGGQQQRVGIAMALMGDPDIVVADEPTASLDAVVRAQVIEVLMDIVRERGTSLLLISHDLRLVRSVADRAVAMYAGRAVEVGAPADLLDNPAHPYVRALVAAGPGAAPSSDGRLPQVPGIMPEEGREAPACTFAPRCPLACGACLEGVPSWALVDGDRRHVVRCVRVGGGA